MLMSLQIKKKTEKQQNRKTRATSQGDASIRTFYASLRDRSYLGAWILGMIWKRELGVVKTEEMWDDFSANARKITVCNPKKKYIML